MASGCIQSCINDAHVPVRATYVNLYKWPESDAEFVKTVGTTGSSSNVRKGGVINNHHHNQNHPRVVDSISCRQMYLRSYTFSRKKESMQEKTKKCIGRVRERVNVTRTKKKRKVKSSGSNNSNNGGFGLSRKRQRPCVVVVMRKAKEVSCAALLSVFRRLLFCTTMVDVVDHDRRDY